MRSQLNDSKIVTIVGILRINESDFLRKPTRKNGIRIPYRESYKISRSYEDRLFLLYTGFISVSTGFDPIETNVILSNEKK